MEDQRVGIFGRKAASGGVVGRSRAAKTVAKSAPSPWITPHVKNRIRLHSGIVSQEYQHEINSIGNSMGDNGHGQVTAGA